MVGLSPDLSGWLPGGRAAGCDVATALWGAKRRRFARLLAQAGRVLDPQRHVVGIVRFDGIESGTGAQASVVSICSSPTFHASPSRASE